jgi:FeoC like transcriptional regulator
MTTSPLRSVLTAFEDGARSRADVCTATGLRRDVVDAAIEHLLRMGRLDARELAVGCPSGGCGSCASGVGDAPGCGAPGASARRSGPVLVSLSVRRPGAG